MWTTPEVVLLAQASDAAKFYMTVIETFDRQGNDYGSPNGLNQE